MFVFLKTRELTYLLAFKESLALYCFILFFYFFYFRIGQSEEADGE